MPRTTLVAAIAAIMIGISVPAAAEPPKQVTLEDDATFQSGRLTRACGFPVFVSVQGTVHITLRTDKDGVLHETDAFEDWSVTFSAPSTGESFSVKLGPLFFEYPEGVFIGAPSIATFHGVNQNTPNGPAQAGRVVREGTVVAITPEGVPLVDTSGPIISENGNILDPAESMALICAALTGS